MSRYARQTVLPEIGAQGQARLAAARVMVVGAGGLGSAVLPLLAGAGIGALRLIDPDIVAESNLHRQTLFEMGDLGRPKVEAAAAALSRRNPDCAVTTRIARLDPLIARAEISGLDLVIDAADTFVTSYTLSDICQARGVPLISAAVLARQGHVGGFCGGAPSLRAVFPDLPAQAASCESAGVMGPVVATLGALQAQMALAVLLNLTPSPLGQLLQIDLASWRLSGFRFDGAAEPEEPGPLILSPGEITPEDITVDLRRGEAAPDDPAGRRVVFLCRSGLRAWHAARQLQRAGHARVAIVGEGA
ncbi:MAG: ThiF family adenylyltransferase [Paenirhodobacter sp.]|uniref:ThiF family adenylyltransferase n=1 Tax=Paenirhodobacter sp. TaxID=1965326 RepID=UPI003D117B6A